MHSDVSWRVCADTWRVSPKLTLNYGVRWDYQSRAGADGDSPSFQHPAQYLNSVGMAFAAIVQELTDNLAKDNISWSTRTSTEAVSFDAEDEFRARPCRYHSVRSMPRTATAFLRRVREPWRKSQPRVQLSVPVLADLQSVTAFSRTARDGSLVGLDARTASPRSTNSTPRPQVRGVGFDFKTPRDHNYTRSSDRGDAHPSRLAMSARGDGT